jgi:TPR repeat protein
MERAHAHYKSGNIKMSLSLYTRMATLGYSRAQANAAFILEKHLQQDHQNRGSFLNGVVNSVSRKIFSFFDTGNDDDAKRKEGKREQIHEKEKEVDIYNPPSLSDIRGERALYLYSQAASQGHDFARLKMGDLVFYGFAGLARGDSSSSSSRSSSSRSNSRDNNNNKNYLPDYKRAKALYQRATAATQSAHVQSQARFALGWMHEVGYPSNGVPRDIHLAKRMYDDASTLSNDANVPVKLALMRMRASDAMQTMLESWFVKKLVVGSINSIRRSFGRKDIWSNILDERTEEEIKKDKEEKMKVKKEKEKKVNEEIEKIKLRKSYDMRGNTVVAGSMVKARWRKGRTYYTGYLSKINIDGTMNIQYDDGDVELSVQTRFVQRVTDKLHPLYVKKEKKEKMLKNMKEKIAAASSGTNSGSNIEDGNMGSQDHGKGWFTSSFVVRLLVHDINWDMVALLFVLFLSIAFLLWSVGEIFKSQYWKVMAVIIGCVIHFLLIREYE